MIGRHGHWLPDDDADGDAQPLKLAAPDGVVVGEAVPDGVPDALGVGVGVWVGGLPVGVAVALAETLTLGLGEGPRVGRCLGRWEWLRVAEGVGLTFGRCGRCVGLKVATTAGAEGDTLWLGDAECDPCMFTGGIETRGPALEARAASSSAAPSPTTISSTTVNTAALGPLRRGGSKPGGRLPRLVMVARTRGPVPSMTA